MISRVLLVVAAAITCATCRDSRWFEHRWFDFVRNDTSLPFQAPTFAHAWQALARETDPLRLRWDEAHWKPEPLLEWCNEARRSNHSCVLYMHHLRKAGGTSLRYSIDFKSVHPILDQANATFKVEEGMSLELHGRRACMEQEHTADLGANSVFHLTHFRNPIERLQSMYLFEGRWPQRRCDDACMDKPKSFFRWVAPLLCHPNSGFRPTLFKTVPKGCSPGFRQQMWQVGTNAYIHWFSDAQARMVRHAAVDSRKWALCENMFNVDLDDLLAVRYQLATSFQALVISEWYDWPLHANYTLALFGRPLPARRTVRRDSTGRAARAEEQGWTKFTEVELDHAILLNWFDILLYDWARQVTLCRIKATLQLRERPEPPDAAAYQDYLDLVFSNIPMAPFPLSNVAC